MNLLRGGRGGGGKEEIHTLVAFIHSLWTTITITITVTSEALFYVPYYKWSFNYPFTSIFF